MKTVFILLAMIGLGACNYYIDPAAEARFQQWMKHVSEDAASLHAGQNMGASQILGPAGNYPPIYYQAATPTPRNCTTTYSKAFGEIVAYTNCY